MSHSDDTPVLSPYAPRVDKTPAAVREALDPDWRAQFEADWRAALEQAKETFDLDAIHEVILNWWPLAQLCAKPGGRAQLEQIDREIAAGTAKTVPAEIEFDDITEEEIQAADGRITL
ncbi:DUF6247 family protein [Carbonactinospora thermoautotrophica]|uniref:DUF6247 family protein n=1 Tax=Carbonactinospora thermoautotrophica TaxID=1469144 RepID=UPI000B0FF6CC|nr:DUF6247 family protein [Carbonactinospora thermoautotrophica]